MLKRGAWTALAIDLGASSGRVIAGQYDGQTITLEEIHRFENEPVQVLDRLHWDILRLLQEIKTGLRKAQAAAKDAGTTIASIGIDTWGVDFGLLDDHGRLLGNPVHYRDHRNDGMLERLFQIVPRDEIFAVSGIQFMQLNTICQLLSMRLNGDTELDRAQTLLFIPDLIAYFLTGQKTCEFTIASTSQLLDARRCAWSDELLKKLNLPRKIFLPLIQPGQSIGPLLPAISTELNGLSAPVIAVGTHDTASAVAATPADGGPFAYLSCGTWSLLGTEVATPVLTPDALSLNFTNEGGVCGTFRLLKNIMGLWLLQELRREWQRQGCNRSWPEITRLTAQGPRLRSLIDPDDSAFLAAGDMSPRVRKFCEKTGQPIPKDDAALLRCITESLALKYRRTLANVAKISGHDVDALYMLGGGIQNQLLCQWTANACGKPVLAGPIEATAAGNMAMQMIAARQVQSLSQAREVIKRSLDVKPYAPQEVAAWNEAYSSFERLMG